MPVVVTGPGVAPVAPSVMPASARHAGRPQPTVQFQQYRMDINIYRALLRSVRNRFKFTLR
ncbi:hypothetical protein ACFQUU_28245 [Herbaspirillum sp. GCM10030257]|uniref:hypothetical protein n=1 Tax=Herbaspirillum sp. GCM10030257 TaxID=3273393 RepID=UPI0036076C32